MNISDADAQAGQDAEPERRRPGLRRSFQSLESPAYRAWFFSQVFSASGTMTQTVAMSWFLLRLTGDSVDLGLMATLTFLPVMLISPHAGALVDRVDRRKLLIVTQVMFAVLAAADTLVQLASGDGMRGRMMGLWTMALPGAQVATGPFAGWVTQEAGPRVGFALPAMALTAIAGAGWRALTAGPAVLPDASAETAAG